MVRSLRLASFSSVVATTLVLAYGGVSHRDDDQSLRGSVAGAASGAAGMPNGSAGRPEGPGGMQNGSAGTSGVGGQPEPSSPVLSLCEGNELRWGTPPEVLRFALDATLDGEPIRCEESNGQAPVVPLLLAGAKYLGASLMFTCNDGTFHGTVGIALEADGSCSSYGGAWSSPYANDSEYHSYDATGRLTSTIVLDGSHRVVLDTGDWDERGVATGSLHLELVDHDDATLPPRILEGHFTLKAAAVLLMPSGA